MTTRDSMYEWINNEMYEELLKKPLWTLAAFGSLTTEDKSGCIWNSQYRLINYLIQNQMDRANHLLQTCHQYDFTPDEFLEVVIASVKQIDKIDLKYINEKDRITKEIMALRASLNITSSP